MHIAVTVIGCGPTGLLLSGALARRGHRAIAADRGCSSARRRRPPAAAAPADVLVAAAGPRPHGADHKVPPALGREGPRGSLSAAATGARVPMPRRGSAVPSPGAPCRPLPICGAAGKRVLLGEQQVVPVDHAGGVDLSGRERAGVTPAHAALRTQARFEAGWFPVSGPAAVHVARVPHWAAPPRLAVSYPDPRAPDYRGSPRVSGWTGTIQQRCRKGRRAGSVCRPRR